MAEDVYSKYSSTFRDKHTLKDNYEIIVWPNISLAGAITFIITPDYEYRPDLISYRQYGTIDYEDIITYVNGFTDPIKDFYSGRTIYLPNIDIIEEVYGLATVI